MHVFYWLYRDFTYCPMLQELLKLLSPSLQTLVPRPPSTVCIVGTGVQARGHIQALKECYPDCRVNLWGRNRERADKCASDVGEDNVVVCDSLGDAVREADVVVTVTMPKPYTPVLFGKYCKPGSVICSKLLCYLYKE